MSAAATDNTSFSTSVKAWAAPGRVIVRAAYLESCPFEVQPSAYVHVWGGGAGVPARGVWSLQPDGSCGLSGRRLEGLTGRHRQALLFLLREPLEG